MKKLLLITPHLSTGGAPQFTLNRIELLKNDYEVYCVEYSFLSPHFVVQRNKIINLLDERFFALEHDKDNLVNIINSVNPDIISIEDLMMNRITVDTLSQIKKTETRKLGITVANKLIKYFIKVINNISLAV